MSIIITAKFSLKYIWDKFLKKIFCEKINLWKNPACNYIFLVTQNIRYFKWVSVLKVFLCSLKYILGKCGEKSWAHCFCLFCALFSLAKVYKQRWNGQGESERLRNFIKNIFWSYVQFTIDKSRLISGEACWIFSSFWSEIMQTKVEPRFFQCVESAKIKIIF